MSTVKAVPVDGGDLVYEVTGAPATRWCDIADAATTVDLDAIDPSLPLPLPDPNQPVRPSATTVGPAAVDDERYLFAVRLPAALAYARDHGLNRVTWKADRPRLGIVASGLTHASVERALELLGPDDAGDQAHGLRLVKLGMPWLLDPEQLRQLTAGLGIVLVVEEKQAQVETELKVAHHRVADAPEVLGRALLPASGALDADRIAAALRTHLGLAAAGAPTRPRIPLTVSRSPWFCSGCSHSTSTRAADGTLVGVGIGCHVMVAIAGDDRGESSA